MILLGTSDLHMQITAFDYTADQNTSAPSLARLSTLISAVRAEAAATGASCLLFDNGDTFQGTPVADYMSVQHVGVEHPMAIALNTLRYDAIGLGNHDFDYGLEHLSHALAQASMPVICSNLKAPLLSTVSPSLVLGLKITASDGTEQMLKIGVLSTLPDKTALWSRGQLENRAQFVDPIQALARESDTLREQGADLIIALAHMGLALSDEGLERQNRVQEVAALRNVDAVIGGHTHLRFPGTDHASIPAIDWQTGKVNGKPVVQPGAGGRDLGVMEIEIERGEADQNWRVAGSHVTLRTATSHVPEDPRIVSLAAPVHERTRTYLNEDVAQISRPIHSFFALAAPSPFPALLAHAKHRVIENALANTNYAGLPLVTAASTPLTGGIEGPGNFLFVDAGAVKRRHIAGMNPYVNSIWAVKASAKQLIDWLERAALIFNQLTDGNRDQALINTGVPGFRFDALYGLKYQIDPSQPARFDEVGRQDTRPAAGRISNVTWRGKPIEPDQTFIVATTDHRAGGGGFYSAISDEDIIVRGNEQLQDAVLSYLQTPDCDALHTAKPWYFAPNLNCDAMLFSAPQSEAYLNEIAHLHPKACGQTADGFLRIRLSL
ncbi:MAG: 5'-nucleotidase C-terminal domain-containing protein [Pseudomonadota bacterium]